VSQQPRERRTGLYSFQGNWERLCECGHALGLHTAQAPHECMAGDATQIAPEKYPVDLGECDCVRFRPKHGKKSGGR